MNSPVAYALQGLWTSEAEPCNRRDPWRAGGGASATERAAAPYHTSYGGAAVWARMTATQSPNDHAWQFAFLEVICGRTTGVMG
jgi:hypothetical protein